MSLDGHDPRYFDPSQDRQVKEPFGAFAIDRLHVEESGVMLMELQFDKKHLVSVVAIQSVQETGSNQSRPVERQ